MLASAMFSERRVLTKFVRFTRCRQISKLALGRRAPISVFTTSLIAWGGQLQSILLRPVRRSKMFVIIVWAKS